MSDDTTPPPTPLAAKRVPRRRTTPAKAATAPKPKRSKVAAELADGAVDVSASSAQPATAPSRPRRRKAAVPAAAQTTAKRKPKSTDKTATSKTVSREAAPPKRPRTRKAKAGAPDSLQLVEAKAAAPLPDAATTAEAPVAAVKVAGEDTSASAPVVDEDTPGLALGESPVDLPGTAQDEASGLRWASAILLVASPLLLLFNSHAIDNWARQLPVNSWSGPVIDAAIGWHATMQRIGFAAPVDAGRAGWKRLKGEPS